MVKGYLDKTADAVVLLPQVFEEAILKSLKLGIGLAGDCDSRCLVLGCLQLDLLLQRVVVDVAAPPPRHRQFVLERIAELHLESRAGLSNAHLLVLEPPTWKSTDRIQDDREEKASFDKRSWLGVSAATAPERHNWRGCDGASGSLSC